MEKKSLLNELDKAISRIDDDILPKLNMNDCTFVTKKELREYILTIQFDLLAIRDVIEELHREKVR